MIYAHLSDGTKLIIVEPGNFDRLRVGKPLETPDKTVLIAFTPDIRWTAEQIEQEVAKGGFNGEKLSRILLEGLKRPEIHEREYHPKRVL